MPDRTDWGILAWSWHRSILSTNGASGKPGAIYLPTALVMNNPLRVSRHEIRDPLIAHGAKPEEQLPHRVID